MAPSEDVFRAVVDALRHPTLVIRPDDRVLHANPASEATLGYGPADLVGRSSHEALHRGGSSGTQFTTLECPLCRSRSAGLTAEGRDAWFIRRDGSMFPIDWCSSPIPLSGGVGAVLSFSVLQPHSPVDEMRQDRRFATQRESAMRRIAEDEVRLRLKISDDLHDGAQQHLVLTLIALNLLGQSLSDPEADVVKLTAEAAEHAHRAVTALRQVVTDVHPSVLAHQGLVAAVQSLAEAAPVPVDVTGPLDRRFDAAVEAHAYFFVVQALSHAGQQAHASLVAVAIVATDDLLTVDVVHDGDSSGLLQGGDDWLGRIADRVAAMDGTVTLSSRLSGGTSLSATFSAPAGSA